MTKKEYFDQLISLYEATNTAIDDGAVEPTQEKIVNTGSDIKDNNVDPVANPAGDENLPNDEIDNEGLDDANYLNPNMEQPEPSKDPAVSDTKKLVRLFNLFKNLLTYSEAFYDSLLTIDIDSLDFERLLLTKKYAQSIQTLGEKIRSYLEDNFKNDDYEKALYIYILLRTELLTATRSLREVLELNVEDEKENKNKI